MVSLTRFPVATAEAIATGVIYDAANIKVKQFVENPLYQNLVKCKEAYSQGFNKMRTSPHTANLMAADEGRGRRLVGLRAFVLAHTYSWDPTIKAAADEIMAMLDSHGTGIETLSHSEESGKIHKILNDLGKEIYSKSIATIALQPWIVALTTAENEFELVDADRTAERASTKDIASATKQRKELQVALKNFIKYVEVMAEMNDDQSWRNLLAQINQRIAAAEAGYRPVPREKKEKTN